MTGFVRRDVRPKSHAEQREVTNTIHHLMPDELVWRAELRSHDTVTVQHDAIGGRRSLSKPELPELFLLVKEAKRTRVREFPLKHGRGKPAGIVLRANHWMRELDGHIELERVRRCRDIHRIAVLEPHLSGQPAKHQAPRMLLDAGSQEGLEK